MTCISKLPLYNTKKKKHPYHEKRHGYPENMQKTKYWWQRCLEKPAPACDIMDIDGVCLGLVNGLAYKKVTTEKLVSRIFAVQQRTIYE